jgi:hypothetical protein
MLRPLRLEMLPLAVLVAVAATGCRHTSPASVQTSAETSAPGASVAASPATNVPPPQASAPVTANAPAAPGAPGSPDPGEIKEPTRPVGPAAAMPSEGVKIAYKFIAGAKKSYEVRLQQQATVTLPTSKAAASTGMQPGSVAKKVEGTLLFIHEVKSATPRGEGEVATHVQAGDIRLNAPMRGEAAVHLENGHATALQNGTVTPFDPKDDALIAGFANQGVEMRLAPTGKTLSRKSAADTQPTAPQAMMEGAALATRQVTGGYGMLVLPSRPIKRGDSWTDTQDQTIPGAGQGGRSIRLKIATRYTLKDIVQQGGSRIAVIESSSSLSMPRDALNTLASTANQMFNTGGPHISMKINRFAQTVTGTAHFDIDRGDLLLGHYRTRTSVVISISLPKMPAGSGGAGMPAGMPPGGAMTITTTESGTIQVTRK